MIQAFTRINELGVVPIAIVNKVDDAVPLGYALLQGGITAIEVSMRTPAAIRVIETLAREMPDMLVGAASILEESQAQSAMNAGAKFIVTPGLYDNIITWSQRAGVPLLPGVTTPTEVGRAWRRGLMTLKLFPVENAGGTDLLRVFWGPFRQLHFVPAGGINEANLPEYLAQPNVLACAGSWLAPSELIASGDFAAITARARAARDIVRHVRAKH